VTKAPQSVGWSALSVILGAVHASPHAAQKSETLRGYLMPFKCQNDDTAMHTRDCALRPECLVTGYGLKLTDGTFLQFDLEGSTKAVSVLRASTKAADLRAVAEGTRVGPLLRLKSLRLE
jgi:hypothetical protein